LPQPEATRATEGHTAFESGFEASGFDGGGFDGGFESGGFDNGGFDNSGFEDGGFENGGFEGGFDDGGFGAGGFDSEWSAAPDADRLDSNQPARTPETGAQRADRGRERTDALANAETDPQNPFFAE
jgi:hypothetical protein